MTEAQRMEMWSACDSEGMAIPCLGERLPAGLDRSIMIYPPPFPFGLLPDAICAPVLHWLVGNVATATRGKPAVYVSPEEINSMLVKDTGIVLTDTQLREALLSLGLEPWDTVDWIYRLHKDCPAAKKAAHGSGLHVVNNRA